MASLFVIHLVAMTYLSHVDAIIPIFGDTLKWIGTQEPVDGEEILYDKLPSGALMGRRRPIVAEAGGVAQKVDWFLGIPYAEPPIEHMRFNPPEPVKPWKTVRQASQFGPVCPQPKRYMELSSSEDCLTLNIFSPVAGDRANFPVIVFIHGESYQTGTGASYLGHILAQQGIVVVTLNYRLGILGFISGRAKQLLGNYGLLDQIEALKWVQSNIHHFRGDRNQVTLYGNNAGATSVGILSVSPLAEGLFKQAILQGGSPLAMWAAHNASVDLDTHTRQTAEVYDCSGWLFGTVVHCLRYVNVTKFGDKDLAEQVPDVSVTGTNFMPVEDGEVIPKPIRELYTSGRINPSRIMIGVSDDEWSSFIDPMIKDLKEDRMFDRRLSDGFNRSSYEKTIRHTVAKLGWDPSLSDIIIQEYTKWTGVDDPLENKKEFIRFINDLTLKSPAIQLASILANRNIPVYLYNFNHRSEDDQSTSTQTDVNYVFGGPYMNFSVLGGHGKDFSSKSQDKPLSQYMMTLWTDFVYNRDPSHSTHTQATKTKWTQFHPMSHDYLSLNNTPSMLTDFNKQGNTFWNDVIANVKETLYQPPDPWYKPTILVWVLVGVGGFLLLLVFILAILLCIRGRHSDEKVLS